MGFKRKGARGWQEGNILTDIPTHISNLENEMFKEVLKIIHNVFPIVI